MQSLSNIEICAGAGGQALGLEWAGFEPEALVEIDAPCCQTLAYNRPEWNVIQRDVRAFEAISYKGIDLLSGGVPCPPFSKAGKQLGENDERDLFPEALRLVEECRPRAVMLENVRGFLDAVFEDYRMNLKRQLEKMGYIADWRLLNASDYGVSQLRPRVVIVAIKKDRAEHFSWPVPHEHNPPPVGDLIYDEMSSNGWKGAGFWKKQADDIAPTIVGGSKKHGGPDLGPTRAKKAWASLGVDGMGIANDPPAPDFTGKKTQAYRQVGNAFPPPVARAVSMQIKKCLAHKSIFSVAG